MFCCYVHTGDTEIDEVRLDTQKMWNSNERDAGFTFVNSDVHIALKANKEKKAQKEFESEICWINVVELCLIKDLKL